MKMRILVTGAKGMLGSDLCKSLSKKHKVLGTDRKCMDVSDYKQVFETTKKFKPDLVIHLAAKTDVDACEIEIEDTYKINSVGTKNMALACQRLGCSMAYISTGSVFDGKKSEPYVEFDVPNPQSVYSKSKYQGELTVRSMLNRYYIFRAGWMFGGGKEDKKFVAKIISLAKGKKELKVVNDKIGSPTYTYDMSKCIGEMIETGLFGTYHMANNGSCTRYEFAKRIIEFAGIKGVNIIPISSREFPEAAPRPNMEAIRNLHLSIIRKNTMRDWDAALKDYVEKLIKEY